MIRINGKNFEGLVVYSANVYGDVSATFTGGLSDEDIFAVLNATELVEVNNDTHETIAIYSLIRWRGMEQRGRDLTVFWQTYVVDEVDSIRTDTEDLTRAVLELAAIIGGGENG